MSKRPKLKKKKATPPEALERQQAIALENARRDADNIPPAGKADRPFGGKFSPKDSPAARQIVLNWLAKGYSYARAATEAGATRDAVFDWRRKDPKFNEACLEAVETGTDYFEDEAKRRAVDGVDRPIFQGGVLVGHERQYSDALLQMSLKGRRPNRYNDKVEHTGEGGGAIKHDIEVAFIQPKGNK